jgi:beta-glucosidase
MKVQFPEGFHWGTATASYQIEGSCRADGKGESIWDRFSHTPGRIATGETGDQACDSYLRFTEDRQLMQAMNQTSYRFSISWPRIQPEGQGAPLAAGLDHYRRVVDDLLEAGIRPFPTLYHWDLPQALQDRGGWANRDTAGRFADYAHHVASALADRVDDWILLNEPSVFTTLGYGIGLHAPGMLDTDAFFRSTHTANLAQGDGARAVRAVRGDVRVGSALAFSPCEPVGDTDADLAASERFHRFTNAWYLDPALHGRYPEAFVGEIPYARMGVREGDLERTRTELDFIGVNLYTRTCVRQEPDDAWGIGGRPIGMGGETGPRTEFGWEIWPNAMRDMLVRLTKDYDRPVLEVTESGCSFGDGPDPSDGVIRDTRRIDYYRDILVAVHEAIEAGADVRGYHAWTLLDNFEWAEGTRQRFGLAWVDFETGSRTLKESGHWYGRVAAENGFET